jgi:hypothetical protein
LFIDRVRGQKWNWIGHTLRKRNEAIETEALDWNLQGKRRRGHFQPSTTIGCPEFSENFYVFL